MQVQWRSGSEEFDDLGSLEDGLPGDRTIRLTGQAMNDALIDASYTLTGLKGGTTYFVRVTTPLLSNVVSGTPVDSVPVPLLVLVPEGGMTVDIVFSEDLDTTRSAPAASAFAVAVGTAGPVQPSSVAFHSTDADTFTLTMSTAIAARAAVSVDYTRPASNALADDVGQEADSFTLQALYPPTAPGTPTLTPNHRVLDVAWTAPADDGVSAVTGYTVQWRTNSQTWDDAVAAGQTAAATASPYEITGLTNRTTYRVRVIAANAAGSGPASPEQTGAPAPPPTIVNVEVTSTPRATSGNDTYGVGEDIEITVTFNEAVDVTGAPRVLFSLFDSGNSTRTANFVRGSGTGDLVFAYIVQTGDRDTLGIHIASNRLLGGRIFSSMWGVDANRSHGAPGNVSGHMVNGSLTGADDRLSALSLSGITLDQTFAARTTAYTATVDNSVSSTTVTATASQSGAGVVITPTDADTNTTDHEVTLADGENTITVAVTGTNTTSTRTYTITVTRAASRSDLPPPKNLRAVTGKGIG